MKKIPFLNRLATLAFAAILLFIGCKKEENKNSLSQQEEEQVAMQATEAESESQFVFDDVFNSVIGVNAEVGMGGTGIFGRTDGSTRNLRQDSIPSCVKVSITPLQLNAFPKTVVIDFGTGCEIHGHIRSGKITTVYSGRLIEPGNSATTTFENYIIDTIAISGTHKVTNTTTPGANQRQFKIEISNAKLTRPNGNYQEWTATRVHTQIEGNGTLAPADDIFRTTGSSTGTAKRGSLLLSWSSEIQEPLIKRFNCRWLSKGTIKTIRTGLPSNTPWVGLLDFGDGTCDNKASLTANGNVRQIVLR